MFGNSIGKRTCDALYMLVGQAIKYQEIWQYTKIDNSILDIIYNIIKNIILLNNTNKNINKNRCMA
ncbi:hypothetical protein [Clostridioides sp. ES-S-0054-01]|uniref:hypothetical protein n=1 Tax=Clostridioides sp. ES-S-0054-01 TaxID=2770780 RepID=UPI001F44774C